MFLHNRPKSVILEDLAALQLVSAEKLNRGQPRARLKQPLEHDGRGLVVKSVAAYGGEQRPLQSLGGAHGRSDILHKLLDSTFREQHGRRLRCP